MDAPPMSALVRERSPFDEQRGRDREPRERDRSRSYSPRDRHERGDRDRAPRVGNNTQWQEVHLKKARLFVGNIDPNIVQRRDFIDIFSQHGNVLGVSVHKGFAFVQMDSERNANRAINQENGTVINGQKIHVEFSSAALKAGARFKRVPIRAESPQPSSHHRELHDDFIEERMSNVLALERELEQELSYIKTIRHEELSNRRGGNYSSRYESYNRSISPPMRRDDSYQRPRSSPPRALYGEPSPRSRYSSSYSQYTSGGGWGQDRQSGRGSYTGGGSSFHQSGWR